MRLWECDRSMAGLIQISILAAIIFLKSSRANAKSVSAGSAKHVANERIPQLLSVYKSLSFRRIIAHQSLHF